MGGPWDCWKGAWLAAGLLWVGVRLWGCGAGLTKGASFLRISLMSKPFSFTCKRLFEPLGKIIRNFFDFTPITTPIRSLFSPKSCPKTMGPWASILLLTERPSLNSSGCCELRWDFYKKCANLTLPFNHGGKLWDLKTLLEELPGQRSLPDAFWGHRICPDL